MNVATHYNPFTGEFWGLLPLKRFVVKHGEENRFSGYDSLELALAAKTPKETVYEFQNQEWHEIKTYSRQSAPSKRLDSE